jgi:hypothetical protein
LSPELSLKKGDELGNEFIPVVEDSSRETRGEQFTILMTGGDFNVLGEEFIPSEELGER